MSRTSKSPRKVLVTACEVAQATLPEYSHRFSPKTFTQHQLFACLVLKTFLKTDYRGLAAHLSDGPNLCEAIELERVPHFTTFQKAARRLLRSKLVDQLFYNQISNISAVSGLTNLTELGLHINQISDITPVAGLTNLTLLSLGDNQISNISAVSGLTNLTTLLLPTVKRLGRDGVVKRTPGFSDKAATWVLAKKLEKETEKK